MRYKPHYLQNYGHPFGNGCALETTDGPHNLGASRVILLPTVPQLEPAILVDNCFLARTESKGGTPDGGAFTDARHDISPPIKRDHLEQGDKRSGEGVKVGVGKLVANARTEPALPTHMRAPSSRSVCTRALRLDRSKTALVISAQHGHAEGVCGNAAQLHHACKEAHAEEAHHKEEEADEHENAAGEGDALQDRLHQ